MNRINPIHVGILLIVVLVFIMMKLSGAKDELVESKELYKETLQLSTELKGLNKIYNNKKEVKKLIEKVLKHNSLKSSNIEKKVTKSSIVISSQSMDRTALNLLMGKFLNGSYNIYSLNIKKLSDKKVSFKMEIKW